MTAASDGARSADLEGRLLRLEMISVRIYQGFIVHTQNTKIVKNKESI